MHFKRSTKIWVDNGQRARYEFIYEGLYGVGRQKIYTALRAFGESRYSGKSPFGVHEPPTHGASLIAEMRWPNTAEWEESVSLTWPACILRVTLSSEGEFSKATRKALEPESDKIRKWFFDYFRAH